MAQIQFTDPNESDIHRLKNVWIQMFTQPELKMEVHGQHHNVSEIKQAT